MIRFSTILAAALLGAGAASASTFDLVYAPLWDADDEALAFFGEAEALWESLIPGYQPGISIDSLTVEVGIDDIDGEGDILAGSNWLETTEQAGFVLPTYSFIDFDVADLVPLAETGELFSTLLHETAHAMGFGTLWVENGLNIPGTGEYTGANGLAAYRAEFDPDAAFVPVEREGGEGTADGHWAEGWAGGSNDLMTGYAEPNEVLSTTTVISFADMGYLPSVSVEDIPPVPLPAGIWLSLGALGGLAGLRRR